MSKIRILVFIDWFDPAYKAGGPVTSIRNIVRRYESKAKFFIVTGNREYGNGEALNVLNDCWINYGVNSSVYYTGKISTALISRLYKEVNPDQVYINGIYSLKFSIWPLIILKNKSAKIIIAPRGMLSAGSMAVKSLKKKLFISLAKSLRLYGRVTFHATSSGEINEIRSGLGESMVVNLVQNLPSLTSEAGPIEKKPDSLKLACIARIAPEKNILYAIELMASLDNGCVLDLYGPVYDHAYMGKIEHFIKSKKLDDRVVISNAIRPEEISVVMKLHHILILPSSGENFGHIIVETLGIGRPVLISDKTPWRNLSHTKAGYDIDLENTGKWLEALRHFQSMDQSEYDQWCLGARQFKFNNVSEEEMDSAYASLFGF